MNIIQTGLDIKNVTQERTSAYVNEVLRWM